MKAERRKRIRIALADAGVVHARELAERSGVDLTTMHRDLCEMEEEGCVTRHYVRAKGARTAWELRYD